MRRLKLHWLFLATAIPVLIGMLALSYFVYERAVAQAQADVLETAKALHQTLDRQLLDVQKFTQAVAATSSTLDDRSFKAFRSRATSMLEASDLADVIALIDDSGHQLVNTLSPAAMPAPHAENMAHVRQVYATKQPYIGDVIVGTVAKRPLITVDVPVVRDGRVIYDVAVGLLSTRLASILVDQHLPAGWYAVIFDRNGTIAARTHEPEKYVGQKVAPDLLRRLDGPLEEIYESRSLEGTPIIAAYARSQRTGYGVAIGVPRTLLLEQLRTGLILPAIGLLAAILTSLMLIWRFSHRIAGALESLSSAVEAAREGRTKTTRVAAAPAEIALLARQFDDMLQERERAEADVRQSRAELAEITASLGEGVYVLNEAGIVTFVNPEGERLLGWTAAELVGRNGHETFHHLRPDGTPVPFEKCPVALTIRTGQPFHNQADWFVQKDGRFLPVAMVSSPIIRDGEVRGSVVSFTDITERLTAETIQRRLTRALRMVSECNTVLIHAEDEASLLDAICKLVVETGGYRMAWIGTAAQDAGRTVRAIAHAGFDDGYLDSIQVSGGDGELGSGPTGTAIRTRATQVNHDSQVDVHMTPWREAALKHGYHSSISLPLLSGEQVLGALTIYGAEPHTIRPEEISLLEQLAGDLAFGMAALRGEEARRQAVADQREVEERYRLVLDNAADPVLVIDRKGRFVYANQQAAELLGYGTGELLRMGLPDVVPHDDVAEAMALCEPRRNGGRMRAERNLRHSNGSVVPAEIYTVGLPDGNLYAACRDITERRNYEAQLEYRATHDPLTGLANRNLTVDRIEQLVVHSGRLGRSMAAMLLDLDRFKLVNDSLGHELGDALLQDVARDLVAGVRAGDTVARLGGDEFMVVVSDLASEDDAAGLARKLLNAVGRPRHTAGHELLTTASLGIAVFPRDGQTASELIKNADVAMYRAKELGRNSFQFYAPEMNARTLERLELEGGLRRALEQHELELYYQPKVELRCGHVVGAEALLRWRHPKAGLMAPADFIPLAEETGLILPIGEWVIETACEQIQAWKKSGLGDITVAVNLSARQFQQDGLVDMVARALGRNGLAPQFLELEVTETVIMDHPERAARLLEALQALGVHISLDDFGTGYSSLHYLKRFPIDALKIDQSFVRDITSNPDDAAIAKLVIALGRDLGHKVIAEGVETQAQLQFLRTHQCDEIQGYLFSRPVPAEEFATIIREDRHLDFPAASLEDERTLLLVDDEAHVLSSLKRLLRPDGYRILTATSAMEALDLLALNDVQVIVSDQRMPEMNGTEFLRRVWQIYPDTIRILLTGYTEINSVMDAVNNGAILKFLTKPWDDEHLRQHVRDAFRYHKGTKTQQ